MSILERVFELIRQGHYPRTAVRIANCEARDIVICDELRHNDSRGCPAGSDCKAMRDVGGLSEHCRA